MGHARPRWHSSLLARLLLVVAIPMGAFWWVALDRISHDHEVAAAAQSVLTDVELQGIASAVYAPANLERLGLQGLAYLDQHQYPRDEIADATGLDFQRIYEDNRSTFEQALDHLAAALEALRGPRSAALADDLSRIRVEIDQLRVLSSELRATTDAVGEVFERLEVVLAGATAGTGSTGHGELVREELALNAFNAAISSAGEATEAVFESVLSSDPAHRERAIDIVVTHEAHLATLSAALGPTDEGMLTEFLAANPLADRQQLAAVAGADWTGVIDVERLATTTDLVVHQLAYVDAFEEFARQYSRGVTERAEAQAEAAHRSAEHTELLLWGLAVLSLTCVIAVTAATMRPLRRLTRRSSEIAAGQLAFDPLPVHGPSDVRTLTSTVNDMFATLRDVDAQVRLLANAQADNVPVELPGAIGIALRDSFRHLRETTLKLQRSEQLASAIVAQAADAIWITTLDGVIRSANQVSAELTGVDSDEQVGRNIAEFLSSLEGRSALTIHGGGSTPVLVASRRIESGTEPILAITAHDVSERARFEAELSHQARHDNLTALPNRFAVIEHLDERAREGAAVALLFIDLDGFKGVNDMHGHAAGDSVLAKVGGRLRSAVRSDVFVGRLGGDEFVVIGTGSATTSILIDMAQRLIHEIERPYAVGQHVFALSASIGIAFSPILTGASDLLHRADIAVYHAKRRGRGQIELFDEQLRDSVEHDAEIELALRTAVRRDELVLHLQPIIDIESGRPTGAEVLVRWERPGVGIVPPADFIQIAERSSLIIDIERWVLHQACEHAARWRRADPESRLRLSVNISGRHLIDGDLIGSLDHALAATGADPSTLEFELTESQLLTDFDRATVVLNSLRGRGVQIAVDDFGTGYSSMTYLRHLPIDTIKIDRSFVQRAADNAYDAMVVDAVLRIGQTLSLNVVAEGIETCAQLDFVRARGCDRAQGFFLSPPLPVEQAELRLSEMQASHELTRAR